jgi:hypothetical protein
MPLLDDFQMIMGRGYNLPGNLGEVMIYQPGDICWWASTVPFNFQQFFFLTQV